MRLKDRTYRLELHRLKQTATEVKFFLPLPDPLLITEHSLEFKIEKSHEKTPNKCDLKIRNMAPASRAELERDGVYCFFAGGYGDTPRRLFEGDVTFVSSYRDGADWLTEMQIHDGANAISFARINRSFAAGVRIIDIVRACVQSMGLALPSLLLKAPELQVQFGNGFSASGKAASELTTLLARAGYRWSIQDGKMLIMRDDEVLDTTTRRIAEDTGMIGSPKFGKPEKKGKPPKRTVKSALYPELQIFGKVEIDSRDVKGIFKIDKLRHQGDTDGNEWTTELEVVTA